jgi:hypothetical protein
MNSRNREFLIQEVLESLDSGGEQYRILPSELRGGSVQAIEWMKRAFPIAQWGRVLWSAVPESVCIEWREMRDLVTSFHALCEKEDLGDPIVVVAWSNALRPSLELRLSVVIRHAKPIFEMDFDTWVICEANFWCIECYHEGELCLGREEKGDDLNSGRGEGKEFVT